MIRRIRIATAAVITAVILVLAIQTNTASTTPREVELIPAIVCVHDNGTVTCRELP